jgi:hypothetical protein
MEDFIIHVEGESFSIGRYVLAGESSVFKAMFESEMSENTNGEMTILDYSVNVVKALLNCLKNKYCLWNELNTHSDQLFSIILKYDFVGLSTSSERYFIDNLDTNNALTILKMSDFYNRTFLKNTTMDYIVKYGVEILKFVNIADVIGSDLTNELFLILLSRARPKETLYTLNCGVALLETFVRVEGSGIPQANGEYCFDITRTDKSASFVKIGWLSKTQGKYHVFRSTLLATSNYLWVVRFKPERTGIHDRLSICLYTAYDSEDRKTPHSDLTWSVCKENKHVVAGPEPSCVKCLIRG